VPLLVSLGGATAALVGVGAILVAAVALALPWLATVDRRATVPVVQIALLRSMRLFRLLPAPALESLAGALSPVRVPAGTDVVEQGASGDRFYAIASGEVDVVADGVRVATLGRADGFGEIALVDDVPRTATVTARSDLELYVLERAPFVTAITGHSPSAQEASDLVSRRRQELAHLAAS
jgi:CRP-like cAMP-binding protein